jgi:hypothetical protein
MPRPPPPPKEGECNGSDSSAGLRQCLQNGHRVSVVVSRTTRWWLPQRDLTSLDHGSGEVTAVRWTASSFPWHSFPLAPYQHTHTHTHASTGTTRKVCVVFPYGRVVTSPWLRLHKRRKPRQVSISLIYQRIIDGKTMTLQVSLQVFVFPHKIPRRCLCRRGSRQITPLIKAVSCALT